MSPHAGPTADTDPDSLSDQELLAAHVAGDPVAFGSLFTRHRDRLWAVALRTTGDPDEAADALQDAMVSAFRRAGSYRGEAAVTTWLHRVVVNACLDRRRRQRVRRTSPLPEREEELHDGSQPDRSDTVDPAEVVLGDEQRQVVTRALATLPVEQRVALVLVDMQGFTVAEAAEVLGCAPGTVKSRCSRGRSRLAPLLADLLGRRSGEPEDATPRQNTDGGTDEGGERR